MSSILGIEGVPVKVVRVEDMDKSTEGESIVPTGGEVGHRDWVILQTILNPHQDHLLCTRARPEKRNVGTFKTKKLERWPCSRCRCGEVCRARRGWEGGVPVKGSAAGHRRHRRSERKSILERKWILIARWLCRSFRFSVRTYSVKRTKGPKDKVGSNSGKEYLSRENCVKSGEFPFEMKGYMLML